MKAVVWDFIKINLPLLAATVIIQTQRLFNFPAGLRFRINQSQFYFLIQKNKRFILTRAVSGHSLIGLQNGAMLQLGGKVASTGAFRTAIWQLKGNEMLKLFITLQRWLLDSPWRSSTSKEFLIYKSIPLLRAQLLELRFVSTDRYITLQARTLHFRSTESILGTMKISKRSNWLAIMITGTTIQFSIKLLMIRAKQTSSLRIQNKPIFYSKRYQNIFPTSIRYSIVLRLVFKIEA